MTSGLNIDIIDREIHVTYVTWGSVIEDDMSLEDIAEEEEHFHHP